MPVPAGVFRTFKNNEERLGCLMPIFDLTGDPYVDVTVSQEMYDKYYKADAKSAGHPPKLASH